jgi:hypothetical protein
MDQIANLSSDLFAVLLTVAVFVWLCVSLVLAVYALRFFGDVRAMRTSLEHLAYRVAWGFEATREIGGHGKITNSAFGR